MSNDPAISVSILPAHHNAQPKDASTSSTAIWLRWRTREIKRLSDIHQFRHAVHGERAHRILAMFAHGERTDAQPPGDFLAGQSVADKPNDLQLTRPQARTGVEKSIDLPSE
jgi:hypothetical protein